MFNMKGINTTKQNGFHGSHKVCTGLCMLEFIMDLHCNYLNIHKITLVPFRILTYLLHEAVLLEKLPGSQLVKKFPGFYGTQRFIIILTSSRQLSLSWARSIQSKPPHSTSWKSILILSSHLHLGLPIIFFPSDFGTKTLYTPLVSPLCATCPANPILDLIAPIIFGEDYSSLSSSLCSFLHFTVTSSVVQYRGHVFHNTEFDRGYVPVTSLPVAHTWCGRKVMRVIFF